MESIRKQFIITFIVSIVFICLKHGFAQPDLEITGIFYEDEAKSYAIVNGEIVKEGDTIDGAEVIEITEDSIKFQIDDEFIVRKVGSGDKESPKHERFQEKSSITNQKGDNKYYLNALDYAGRAESLRRRLSADTITIYDLADLISLYEHAEKEAGKAILAVSGDEFKEMQAIRKECQDTIPDLKELLEIKKKIEKYNEYMQQADQYYDSSNTYLEARNLKEAIRALNSSIQYLKKALSVITDNADRTRLDSIIKKRERELRRLKRRYNNR